MRIRPYQDEAATRCLEQADSAPALLVLPTGMGKTVTMQEMATRRASKGPVLLLAHTDELCQQAADRFLADGWAVFTEKAASRPNVQQIRGAMVQGYKVLVVGSVQTMRGKRLQRWPRDFFGLAMVDEAHHAVAATYQRIMEWFRAPWVGVTATAQRKGLAEVFELAYQITLPEAIEMGWLCPPVFDNITLPGWDLGRVPRPRGNMDIKDGDLARTLERVMPDVLRPILDRIGTDRTGILFFPSVLQAHRAAEWLAAADVRAASVDGSTPRDKRKALIAGLHAGDILVMSNCFVLNEGFNFPGCETIVIARPTKSPIMYTQMLGRGLRPLPGVVDAFADGTNEQRKQAIADSKKPTALIVEFHGVGAAFQEDLVTPVKLLAGDLPPVIQRDAERLIRDGQQSVDEAVNEAKRLDAERRHKERVARNEARRRAQVRNGADYVAERVDYLGTLPEIYQKRMISRRARPGEELLTQGQRSYLFKLHCESKNREHAKAMWGETKNWSKRQASKEIDHLRRVTGAAARDARQGHRSAS